MTPPGRTRPAYHPGFIGRPGEREALEIAVGAILTQNTAWTNVVRAIEALHEARAMSLRGLLVTPPGRLMRLIRSSGYFRQKAAKLRDFLRALDRRGGSLRRWLSGELGRVRGELLAVRGIGPETADSILLYAGARPSFVVDAYTLRIGGRLGWFRDAGYDEARDRLVRSLPRSARVYQEFHALLVALAKLHCRTEPLCGACPLLARCPHGLESAP